MVEIRCPADCVYLEAAQKHPAAVVRRQQERDLGVLMASMGRRLSEVQLHTFFLLASVVVRYRPDGLMSLTDADVADGSSAMATTLEAASRGVIAEVSGASPVGEGLRRQFDALLAELGKGAGAGFGQEAAEVLRGIERGAKHETPGVGDGPTDYLTLLARVLPPSPAEDKGERTTAAGIILP